jgi:hypothetical protein
MKQERHYPPGPRYKNKQYILSIEWSRPYEERQYEVFKQTTSTGRLVITSDSLAELEEQEQYYNDLLEKEGYGREIISLNYYEKLK